MSRWTSAPTTRTTVVASVARVRMPVEKTSRLPRRRRGRGRYPSSAWKRARRGEAEDDVVGGGTRVGGVGHCRENRGLGAAGLWADKPGPQSVHDRLPA